MRLPGRSMTGAKPAARRSPEFAATLNDVTSLQSNRGYRDGRGQFFIEGVRNFVRAVENGFTIDRIIFSERLLIAPIARQLVRRCRRSGIDTKTVTPEQFRQLSRTKRASGVAAIVRQRWTRLENASPDDGLACNLGTLVRSSQAVGGAGFILIGNQIDPFGPDVVRASMGAIYRQSFIRTEWADLRRWIRHHQVQVVGATPDGADDLHSFKFARSPLLVLGEERKGLTQRQKGICTDFVRIPMQAGTDSLNVGVAGSLMLYEAFRSRMRGSGVC